VTLPPFQLDRPSTLAEALQLRADGAAAYAGGTELLLAMGIGLLRPDVLADVKRLPELKGTSLTDGVLRIGGGSTHDEVANDPLVRAELPILAKVSSKVGNPRVRVQGTIGGNIVFAEPKSDIVPTLISLEGSVELHSPAGARTVPVADFVVGPYWTDLADDELLVAVAVPLVAGRTQGRPDAAGRVAVRARWQAVADAALEQSRGIHRAVVEDVVDIDGLGDGGWSSGRRSLRLVAAPGAPGLRSVFRSLVDEVGPDVVAVAVGPEGGWTSDELARLVARDWSPVGLGATVLRTEHAGPAALAALAALAGRWESDR
jgi:CO/xanthine dehydrogenase FAD-binding subunit